MSQNPATKESQASSRPGGGRSVFAAGAKLSGDLTVPGSIELLGHIDGKIFADAIVIEEGGSAVGELHAEKVAVKGLFEGDIHAQEVILHSSARISGGIYYKTLTIESGAEVNSACSRKRQD